jgi:hypothetical protein
VAEKQAMSVKNGRKEKKVEKICQNGQKAVTLTMKQRLDSSVRPGTASATRVGVVNSIMAIFSEYNHRNLKLYISSD